MKPSTDPTVPDTALPAPARAAMGQSHFHESARAQVAGGATYIDDMPVLRGTLYAAPILSSIAHGRLHGLAPDAEAPPFRDYLATTTGYYFFPELFEVRTHIGPG